MKKIRFLSLLVVIFIVTVLVAGCGQSNAPSAAEAATTAAGNAATTAASEPAKAELDPYTFSLYFNYDWWGIKPWAEDEVSKALGKKFNVKVEFSKPDSDPQAKLNVMISSGDLPDSIMMDRGVDNIKLAKLGMLLDLAPFQAKNPNLDQNVLPKTQEMLKIEGKLYGIPNWSRKAASGGNDAWVYNERLYKAAGSPKLETFEDLYNYALKVKTDVPKNKEGLATIPVIADNDSSTTGAMHFAKAFYRSFGGYLDANWYSVQGGKYSLVFRDPVFKKAAMELNKWYRSGLISETQFTDTTDQITEKLVAGRTALLWYDQSKDETTHYRRILRETFPDDSYEMVKPFPYPPADGLPNSKIYADHQGTVGWNVTCITKNAKNPQRIFDLWTYLLTPEAAILQMYGPQGQLWDNLNDKGLPTLKKAESELSTDEINKLGLWFWMMPGQSDNVDKTKFAVNDMQPVEKQNWVINNQSRVITPLMWLSDEFTGVGDVVDPKSNEGIKKTLCEDYMKAQFTKFIMAKSEGDAQKLYQGIIDFCDKNGMPAVEDLLNKKYQDNVKIVGTGLNK